MTSAPVRDPLADHLLTPDNAAFLLIDYQPSQLATVRSMDHDLLLKNAVSTVRAIKTFEVPVVHSTVNVAGGQGPTLPELAGLLTDDKPLDRRTVNSWEDIEFVQAVHATGRRKLIICALWTRSAWPSPRSTRCAKGTRSTPSSTRSAAPRPRPTAQALTA
jgi:nicotinamidase-related amidase